MTDRTLTFHACDPRCINGEAHDFGGNRPITDERGRVVGGESVCSRCGMGAMEYSIWVDDA